MINFIMIILCVGLHEFGHFIVAKKNNIPVEEFSIGFGPKIYSRTINKTRYSFRIILLGGYVRIKEDIFSLDIPCRKKVALSAAGPLMNILLSIISFMVLIILEYCNFTIFTYIYPITIEFIDLNFNIGILNLLPLPPLDGGAISGSIILSKLESKYHDKFTSIYSIIALIVILTILVLSFLL